MTLAVPGILDADAVAETVAWIAAVQLADGNVPWSPGARTDPWNLVEAAMALDAGGRHEEARAAYDWLFGRQRPDGAWHHSYVGDDVEHHALDTNGSSYVAVGLRHHVLATGDTAYAAARWPAVEAAIGFVLGHQRSTGEVAWRGDEPGAGALLTASSSVHASLRAAVTLGAALGREPRGWDRAATRLADAIAERPGAFLDKARFAMDWYYPVLGGVLHGDAARDRLARHWTRFVVDGRGARCVDDHPWVTAAETCELVLALDAAGVDDRARELFGWVQFLRADGGGYWTGANFDGGRYEEPGVVYPHEQTTYTAAAVVLAADALAGTGPTAAAFRTLSPRVRVTSAAAPAGCR